jgi:hypothetical protein
MIFGLVSVIATLVLILALNWGRFQAMGTGNVIRLAFIWAAIITGMVLALRLLGFG